MINLGLQYFGGRGASGSGGTTGGGKTKVLSTESLLSATGKQTEINQVMGAVKSVYDEFGKPLNDIQIATLDKKSQSTMAYYDNNGNLAVNKNYFDAKKMNDAYDASAKSGFHPPRGNKSGLEAVASHELGHQLSEEVGRKLGYGDWQLDKASNKIINEAKKQGGFKDVASIRKAISGYATKNNAEAIAEAFADVYCNGKKAKKESQAVVNVLNGYLGR